MPMTERENLLRVIEGKEPAWVPRMGTVQHKYDPENHPPCVVGAMVELFPPQRTAAGGRIDMFGVEYTPTEDTGGQALPTPDRFIMEDVRKWRDIIHLPSLDGIDWRAVGEKAVANLDRENSCVQYGGPGGFFMPLMNMMGFTEGLIAMQEETDAVLEMYDHLANYYETVVKNLIDYIKPDIFRIGDDTAAAQRPFISAKMQREMIKPFHGRLTKYAVERGLPIDMHCCGRCEDFIEDWRDIGVNIWNPAQISNDLQGIKAKYGNSFVLVGCWDSQGPPGWYESE
ncbi:MAG: veratrol--corrinoid protein metyltransferase, partial [Clostridiales bacterium]|nr:veratrol--corrinoid protein metyltransferase [Clostridiales bacterium]